MKHTEIERAQQNYLGGVTMEEYLQSYNHKTMRKVFELCGSGHKILDVGCGDGFIGRILMDNGNDVVGVEIHDEPIREARKKGMKVIKARAQKLPFKSNTFEIVVMAEVIEHFLETEAALAEVRRVLKPGGRVIITTPNFASFRDRILVLFGKLQAFSQHKDHVKFFNKERLIKVLDDCGFEVVKVYGSAFGIPLPKNAKTFFFFDRILPSTLLQCFIAEARKK